MTLQEILIIDGLHEKTNTLINYLIEKETPKKRVVKKPAVKATKKTSKKK